jgi:hypothetical protein
MYFSKRSSLQARLAMINNQFSISKKSSGNKNQFVLDLEKIFKKPFFPYRNGFSLSIKVPFGLFQLVVQEHNNKYDVTVIDTEYGDEYTLKGFKENEVQEFIKQWKKKEGFFNWLFMFSNIV